MENVKFQTLGTDVILPGKWPTNYNRPKYKGTLRPEKNKLPSMTVPDQTMSIKEILDRHTRGLPIAGQKIAFYDPEDDMPDLSKMDLAERQEHMEAAAEEIKAIQEREETRKKEAAEKKAAKKEFKQMSIIDDIEEIKDDKDDKKH